MISKSDIIRIVKHVGKKSRGIPDRRIMHPGRDWVIGLLMAAATFIGLALYATSVFLTSTTNVDSEIVIESSVVKYEQERTMAVLEKYRKTKETFNFMRNDIRNAPVISVEEDVDGEPSEDLLAE